KRRLAGHLVAQALAFHANYPLAAQVKSLRISRIVIQQYYRQQGIARHLVKLQCQQANKLRCDFVSVSFGYTPSLFAFWQKCGFQLVHLGAHKEASSGCYAVMMLYPLTE